VDDIITMDILASFFLPFSPISFIFFLHALVVTGVGVGTQLSSILVTIEWMMTI